MVADPGFRVFYLLTGATFVAFASGFGVCLFDIGTVNECLAVSRHWVDVFHDVGDRIVEWGIAMARGAYKG